MQLQIIAKNFELDDALRAYVEEKITGLEKFKDHILEGHVVMHTDKRHQDSDKYANAEVRLYIGKDLIYGKESGSAMREAIDLVAEKLERQLIKHEGKDNGIDREKIRHLKEADITEE